jgi:hypothetical protein
MNSPEMVEYIRTMVRGDHEANDRIEARLDEIGWDGFPALLGAVFYFAVNQRFNERTSPGEIMRFVADMRAAAPAGTPEIDANAAETLIRAAVDPDGHRPPDGRTHPGTGHPEYLGQRCCR